VPEVNAIWAGLYVWKQKPNYYSGQIAPDNVYPVRVATGLPL
jgi:hypothetical protein